MIVVDFESLIFFNLSYFQRGTTTFKKLGLSHILTNKVGFWTSYWVLDGFSHALLSYISSILSLYMEIESSGTSKLQSWFTIIRQTCERTNIWKPTLNSSVDSYIVEPMFPRKWKVENFQFICRLHCRNIINVFKGMMNMFKGFPL